ARLEHPLGAASRRSLRACSASLPLQSSLMSKTYLKSDHFVGGGSVAFRLAWRRRRACKVFLTRRSAPFTQALYNEAKKRWPRCSAWDRLGRSQLCVWQI